MFLAVKSGLTVIVTMLPILHMLIMVQACQSLWYVASLVLR